MSRTESLAYTGGNAYAYAYTGNNAYAYTGGNAYAYSSPMEAYGFSGFPGNPMLSSAILSTRGNVRASYFLGGALAPSELRWGPAGSGLPALDPVASINRLSGQVRSSMALLELMSSVEFAASSSHAALWGSSGVAPRFQLVTMQRPSYSYFEKQLQLVDSWGPTRDARLPEILTQVAPPIAVFASVMNLQSGRHAKTLELINTCLQFGYAVCMRFKLALNCPRPADYTTGLFPVLETPPHAALPAGHANEAHLTAMILTSLASAAGTDTERALRRVAHRIAENRVVAGLHFPVDNIAGRLLGDSLHSYLLACAGQSGTWTGGQFELSARDPALAGQIDEQQSSDDGRSSGSGCSVLNANSPAPSAALPVFSQMWADARAEWA